MDSNELNQVLENNDGATIDDTEDLFSDVTIDTTDEENHEATEETLVETTEKVEEQPSEPEKAFSLHVKYNGEEKDLNEDEARAFAQKGMNYDRFYEPLSKLAKMNGMEVGDYINRLNTTENEYAVENELLNLKEKYPDTNEEVLKELAQKRVDEKFATQLKKYESEQRDNNNALEQELKRQVDIFKREYPELDPDKLDSKVYEFMKDGYSLTEAYNKWNRIEEEKNKPLIEAQKLNESNKKKSLGNTTNAGSEEGDPFFDGLNSI